MSDNIGQQLADRLNRHIAGNQPIFTTAGPVTLDASNKFKQGIFVPRAFNGGESLSLLPFRLNEGGLLTAVFGPNMKSSQSTLQSVGRIQILVDPRAKGEQRTAQSVVIDVPEEEQLMGEITIQGSRRINLLEWIDEQLTAMDDFDGTTLANYAEKQEALAAQARVEALKTDARFGSW